ncbi:hypothetical protein SERLA73DRAFT_184548, partial [Serpula lacrymans var. lacrymans S7.3]
MEDKATQDEDEDQMNNEDIEPVQNGDKDIPPHEERPDPEFEYHPFINGLPCDEHGVYLCTCRRAAYSTAESLQGRLDTIS